ncbi:unnamed protein product [Dicrocoelium dendriticum]|nr:unnamed protein product [Dicrocoelium dendriticum]
MKSRHLLSISLSSLIKSLGSSCYFSKRVPLLGAFFILYTMAELNNSLNPTGTILKGPVNQTVRVNQKARFQCRTHDRHTHGITSEPQTYRYSKHLSVQWIINGFGVTNETLAAVHGTRYRMPGPPEYGIYDLIISDVRLEDEANLICQATVKLYKASGETVIDTLTSAVTHLNILVPPTGISMKKAESFDKNLHDSAWLSPKVKVVNQQYVKLSTTPQSPTHTLLSGTGHVVADDPTIELTRQDQFLNPKELINKGQNADVKGDAETVPTIWIKEHDTLVMACYTTPSKPAPKITWTLAGRPLEVASYNSQTGSGTYFGLENQPDALASQLEGDQEVRISETYIFAPMKNTEQSSTAQRDNSKDEWGDVGNNTDVHTDTQVTISTLRLIVGRHHRGKPLECSIENAAEYGIPNLPTVGVILEAIYIEKVSILRLQPKEQTEWIEGTTVEFQCQAKSNPPNPSFRWAFVDFESMPNSIATNGTHDIYHHPTYFGKRDKPIQSSSTDPSILNLRLHRGMHRGRVRCWAGVGDAAGLPWSGLHASEKQWVWHRADEEINVLCE